ncbi:MAG: hypothetical protein KatS3mg004_0300 [Bryobacteraceae bacterium]|nr:MAG: hypothetical protein KatS3mg004_0300 [Bryobacteraceae bacterium]
MGILSHFGLLPRERNDGGRSLVGERRRALAGEGWRLAGHWGRIFPRPADAVRGEGGMGKAERWRWRRGVRGRLVAPTRAGGRAMRRTCVFPCKSLIRNSVAACGGSSSFQFVSTRIFADFAFYWNDFQRKLGSRQLLRLRRRGWRLRGIGGRESTGRAAGQRRRGIGSGGSSSWRKRGGWSGATAGVKGGSGSSTSDKRIGASVMEIPCG